MAGSHSAKRTIAALFLLALMVAVFSMLGRWQLHRGAERRAILASIHAGQTLAPIRLDAATPPAEFKPWRRAQIRGRWLNGLTVLLQNRNQDGRPGYWVATPLMLEPAAATRVARGRAVLVLRGWLPRGQPGQPTPAVPPAPDAEQLVGGQMSARVPRLFELWSMGAAGKADLPSRLPVAGGKPPEVQNLDLDAFARAAGIDLMPVVIEQTEPSNDGLVHDWPQPSVDYSENESYALQWFAFAAIAAVAFLVVLFRAWRARRPEADAE